MKKIRKGNIINARIHTVSIVNKGANKKRFFLRKGQNIMNKEFALSLIKSSDANEEVIKTCKEQVPEADHAWLDTEISKLGESSGDSAALGVVAKVLEGISKRLDEQDERLKKQEEKKTETKTETETKPVEKSLDELKKGIDKYIDDPSLDVPEELELQVHKYYTAEKAKGNK